MRFPTFPIILFLTLSACSSQTPNLDLNATKIVEEYLATQNALIPSPSSTSAPTATPIPPTLEPQIESGITENSDGSITYTNVEFGYEMIFSGNWAIIQLTESGSSEFFAAASEAIPEFEELFDYASLFTQGIHMMAFDFDPSHNTQSSQTSVNAISEELGMGFSLEFVFDTNLQVLPQILPGIDILGSFITTNSNDVDLGIIIYSLSQQINELQVDLLAQGIFFITAENLITLTLGTDVSLTALLKEDFESIVDSIKLIDNN